MPQGDKSAYTDKQKRKAQHIEEGYEKRGLSEKEAERRAWATVNAMDHGGKKSGSGVGRKTNKAPAKKGERIGGAASARPWTRADATPDAPQRSRPATRRSEPSPSRYRRPPRRSTTNLP